MKRINWFLCNQTNVVGWLNDWMTYWLIDWHWWIDIDWQEASDLILLVLKHFEAWNDNLQVLKDKGYVFGRLVGFGGLILASGNTLCSFLAYWGFVDCVWDVCSIYCLCWLRFYCGRFLFYSKGNKHIIGSKNEEGHFHGLKERVKGTARLVWLSRVHRAGYRRRIFIFQEGPVPVLQSNKWLVRIGVGLQLWMCFLVDLPAFVASFTFFSARLRCWETLDSTLEFRPGSRANLSVLVTEYYYPSVICSSVSCAHFFSHKCSVVSIISVGCFAQCCLVGVLFCRFSLLLSRSLLDGFLAEPGVCQWAQRRMHCVKRLLRGIKGRTLTSALHAVACRAMVSLKSMKAFSGAGNALKLHWHSVCWTDTQICRWP